MDKAKYKYGIACGFKNVSPKQPVIVRGDYERVVKVAKDCGYDGIELHIENPSQYDPVLLKQIGDNYGMEFCGIATGMELSLHKLSLISDDESVRIAAIDRLKEHIDFGKVIGAPVVVGMMRSHIPDFSRYELYEGYLTHALRVLDAYGAAKNVPLVFESVMRYICNYMNNVPETVDYLDRINVPNTKIHIDTHSMIIEDYSLPMSTAYCAGKMGYVHFTDSNRLYPGGGNVDFIPIIKELIKMDYDGYVSMECVPYPSEELCAKYCIDYIKAATTMAEIELYKKPY